MEKKKLSFSETLTDTINIALKNALSIIGCVVLWLLTIWIPWINIGTTIAIWTLPAELSKGKVISPLGIFDGKYRKKFGEVFILQGLMLGAIIFAIFFTVVPALILSIAWMLAILFVVDQNKNPLDALTASYKATEGNKWTIFGLSMIFALAIIILIFAFSFLPNVLSKIMIFLTIILLYPFSLSLNASVYRQLGGAKIEAKPEAKVESKLEAKIASKIE